MKTHIIARFVIALFTTASLLLAAHASSVQTLTHGWWFQHGAMQASDFETNARPDGWQVVRVPHDWAIAGPFDETPNIHGGTGRLPWKGIARYRTVLTFEESAMDQRHYLDFDGVMANPKIFLNGKQVGEWDYGYTPFRIDLTDHIHFGAPNVLVVEVDTRNLYSRWYPGAGIYRKVQLVSKEPVHFANWGVFSRLADPTQVNRLHVEATVENHRTIPVEVTIRSTLLDGDLAVSQHTAPLQLESHASSTTTFELHIDQPKRWDMDHPHLYALRTELMIGESVIDTHTTPVGLRTLEFTANDGFFLNGRRVQFKGVNLHHDLGPLGAAFNTSAARRQLEIMQSMGVNALRTAHNPAAAEVLQLCDEMGIVVFNEAFDKWEETAGRRAVDDPPLEPFGRRHLEALMLRDRNHPSVIIWSIGNELLGGEMGITPENVSLMSGIARSIDDSRPIALGCHIPGLSYGGNFDSIDLTGWNYARRYMDFRSQYPDKPIIYSESASTVSTRGYYAFPLPTRHTDLLESHQVSSYDLTSAPWSDIPDVEFRLMEQDSWVHGEFVWTGFDYLGEPTPYEMQARSSYFGIVDLCGFEKDRYFLYKSHWKPEETTLHILPHWNWPDRIGQNVPVFVYTNGDSAELFLNGKSLGKRHKGEVPARPANLAPNATLRAGKSADEAHLAHLTDGALDSSWSAATPGPGATVFLDFPKPQELGYLSIDFAEAEKYFGYSIWGTEDGTNWRMVASKPTSPTPQWGGPTRVYHTITGTFSSLRLQFDRVRQEERSRHVAIREIALYPEPVESDYFDVTYDYRLRWNEVTYEPGELHVIAYKNGQPIAERSVHTTGAQVAIRLSPDRKAIHVASDELAFITTEVMDAEGRPCPLSTTAITFSICDNGELVGTDNGNPLSFESFHSATQTLWAGKALLVVRAAPNATGPITITANAEGLAPATIQVHLLP
jgi:hypothetical protein